MDFSQLPSLLFDRHNAAIIGGLNLIPAWGNMFLFWDALIEYGCIVWASVFIVNREWDEERSSKAAMGGGRAHSALFYMWMGLKIWAYRVSKSASLKNK
jgi:hypothetical protein